MMKKSGNRIRLCIPKTIDGADRVVIRNAVVAFGHLLKDNTTVGFRALAAAIESAYAMDNVRVCNIVRTLKRAEPYAAVA